MGHKHDAGNRYEVTLHKDVPIEMKDGIILYADIYYPQTEERLPALLMRSPYDKAHSEFMSYLHPAWYARQGFIVVTQDSRGKYTSEGTFEPFKHERQDGLDTIAFVRSLPQCNGKVGMYGFSYVGATQLQPSVERPEGLTAIAPAFTNDGYYEDWMFKNGALHQAFVQSWTSFLALDQPWRRGKPELSRQMMKNNLNIDAEYDHLPLTEHPLIDQTITPFYYEWLQHPTFDAYWKQWHLGDRYDDMVIPGLHIGGWYDIFIEGTLRNFIGMSARHPHQKLLIGPWYHMPWTNRVGELDFGEQAYNLVDKMQVRWFEYWLNGIDNGIMDEPPISIFVMGVNKWRHEYEWPLARTVYKPFYLHSGGRANSLGGDGWLNENMPIDELPDIYVYNPFDPVPSAGGHSCCDARLTPMGPKDQRHVEIRNDVLVYTTDVLVQDVEVTGPVQAILYAASSAEDTDFTVKLVDVWPEGPAINVLEGIQRASYRNSNVQPQPIEPGKVYAYKFQIGSTSYVFQSGHRIRVEISSSNFPAFDRHLNVFHTAKDWNYTEAKPAMQTILHDADHPSHLILPIIPT